MNKIEGWDCGRGTHLHRTEEEAQRCDEVRQEQRSRTIEMNRVAEAGWAWSQTAYYLIAVNTRTGEGRYQALPNGQSSIREERKAEMAFLESLK